MDDSILSVSALRRDDVLASDRSVFDAVVPVATNALALTIIDWYAFGSAIDCGVVTDVEAPAFGALAPPTGVIVAANAAEAAVSALGVAIGFGLVWPYALPVTINNKKAQVSIFIA